MKPKCNTCNNSGWITLTGPDTVRACCPFCNKDGRKPDRPRLVYEEAAQEVSVIGWQCKTCGHFYGINEHSARWCCATDMPCKTCETGRVPKHRLYCDTCNAKADLERWLKMPEKEWDGEAVLAIWRDDKYFFHPEDLLDELREGDEGTQLENIRLVICKRIYPPQFNLAEHCHDYLPDDMSDDFHTGEIDEAVNKFISEHFPPVYEPTNVRASVESVKKHLGV